MKNKIIIPGVIIVALIAFFSFRYKNVQSEISEDRKSLVLKTVMKTVAESHYSPRQLNDSFSAKVFDDMIKTLDYDKRFFTENEMKQLLPYRFRIDDEIREGIFDFYDALSELYNNRITVTESFYKDLLSQPYSFNIKDSIQLNGEEIEYAVNDTELKARWNKYLKYRVLAKYVDLQDDQKKKKENKDSLNAKFLSSAELEKEARKSVLKNQDLIFKRLKKFSQQEQFNLYVNAITAEEDPHTNYFAPKDKKRFDEGMSGSFVGIGAQLRENEGRIEVVAIIVGSPSWKQGDLKAGDEILKVGQGDQPAEDITGLDIDEVVSKIRGKKGTTVRLSVKRIDGARKEIPIVRGEVSLEETFAKSAIIETPTGKIGYLLLPEFYVDFNNPKGRRSSVDVEKEIEKLKAQQVKGIILDLRNNGGGSLSDVVDITGLFIDEGPVVQVKASGSNAITLKDNVSGVVYDGPLAVMINQGSASASEILAAAIQDYGRGIVIGSTSFGKGTVQRVASLDEALDPLTRIALANNAKGSESQASLGALKLTVQKFYRVNGGSTQLKGVTPDIELPDIYQHIAMGERKEKSALGWDEIKPSPFAKMNNLGNISFIQSESEKRVANNPIFKLIEENALRMKKMEKDNIYPLEEVAFRARMKENIQQSEKMESLQKKGTPLTIKNLPADMAQINRDTSSIAKNKEWLKSISKDIYLSETVKVLQDMKNQPKAVLNGTSKR